MQGELGPDTRNARLQLLYIADKPRRNPPTQGNTTTRQRHTRCENCITRTTLRARCPCPRRHFRIGGDSTGTYRCRARWYLDHPVDLHVSNQGLIECPLYPRVGQTAGISHEPSAVAIVSQVLCYTRACERPGQIGADWLLKVPISGSRQQRLVISCWTSHAALVRNRTAAASR